MRFKGKAVRHVTTLIFLFAFSMATEAKAASTPVPSESQIEERQAVAFAMNWVKALDEEKYEGCWQQVDSEFKARFRNSLGVSFFSIMGDESAEALAASSDEEQFALWSRESRRRFQWIGGYPPYRAYSQTLIKVERQSPRRRWRVELKTDWDLGQHSGDSRHTLIVSFTDCRWKINDHDYHFGMIIDF